MSAFCSYHGHGSSNYSQIDCVCVCGRCETGNNKVLTLRKKSKLTSANYDQIAQTAPMLGPCLPHYLICIIHFELGAKTAQSTCK